MSPEHEAMGAPDFSPFADVYAASRPRYPTELYEWLASVVEPHGLAWDSATGNGQAAVGLAGFFDRVVASDVSLAQLTHAPSHPRIAYWVGRAEQTPLLGGAVDLAVAAAAAHWFDLDAFWREVRRVTHRGSVLAVWSYHVAHLEGAPAERIARFYEREAKAHFGAGARLVDARYETLRLPGKPLDVPEFFVSADWTLEGLLHFVRSWSGVQKLARETGHDPTDGLAKDLAQGWGSEGERVHLRWPIYMKATKL